MNFPLETERLYIRPIEITDVDDMFEMDSDPAVHTYIDQSPVKTKDEIREVIQMIRKQYEDFGIARWAVVDKNTNEMLGWCGLKYFREPLNGLSNIYEHGYRFKQKHWGKGLATESSKAVLNWGFENLQVSTIYAMTDPANENSIHVLTKLGFEFKEKFKLDCGDFKIEECNWFELKKENLIR